MGLSTKMFAAYGFVSILSLLIVGMLLNVPTGVPNSVLGKVISCRATGSRLVPGQSIKCRVRIEDGSEQTIATGIYLQPGAAVVMNRYPRRFVGYAYGP